MDKIQEREEFLQKFFGDSNKIAFEQLKQFNELMVRYNCAVREIRTKFEVLNEELSFHTSRNPIESISSRIKSPVSIVNKLDRKSVV